MSFPRLELDQTIAAEPRQVVVSPEQVTLHLPVTGPTTRMLAYFIDCLVIIAIEITLFLALLMTTPLLEVIAAPLREMLSDLEHGVPPALDAGGPIFIILAASILIQFVVEWGYFVFSEIVSGGRSFGKALLGLRVVRDGGLPLTVEASLMRNLLRMVDILPGTYVVGLVAMVASSQGKRLGDMAAGTIVVRLDRPPVAAAITGGDQEQPTASFRFDRAQIALLGANERALLRQALRRADSLPPERAGEIIETAVSALRQRIGYGPVARDDHLAFLHALLRATQAH